MSDSKFLRGTLIVTLGTFLVKFLGMIYVIPFYQLVKEPGGALYQYGYVPYTIFLSIATAGVPLAVSKFVSKYNELGDYHTSRRMFQSGLVLMTVTGFVSFIVLYLGAPLLAPHVLPVSGNEGNTVEDVTMVIRMVSFALLVVPIMSLIRGFFQGHQSMGPTTLSQLVEQIVRIVFLLTATYLVMEVFDGGYQTAVGWATFAAFIGALGGLAVLLWYWFQRKTHMDKLITPRTQRSQISTWSMYKELLMYAGPFVFVGIATPLYQQIDILTFNKAMSWINQGDIAEELLSIFSMYGHKLIMIPVSLATAFSLTLVPAITKLHTAGDYKGLHRQIGQTLQMTTFLTLPAVVGISVLAYPTYGMFYKSSHIGGEILMWYAPVAILFAFYSVNAAILQGINQQKYAVLSLGYGILVKLVLNIPLIMLFETQGAIIATGLGYFVSIMYTFLKIKKHTSMNFSIVRRRVGLIAIFVAIMAIVVLFTQWILSFFMIWNDGKLQCLLIVAICAVVGGAVYLSLAWMTNLITKVFGAELMEKIQRKVLRRG
ncbi:putative polysaccharide biosynthesis protein [Priestia taiwanensis]|uniref:Cell division protein n=1 Tax=Priestia taiwanensis TaxID=1347902 RepID=A0A917ERK0_9BACI|nr:polysaccharide biosynthesis protein [Priestia taiwanensis]MBM7363379.1 O-antigen/teichoic acid export membrane protein [Priestia taiwanensis]GGE77665.1 cell division protein [Priestia taiwanensis]